MDTAYVHTVLQAWAVLSVLYTLVAVKYSHLMKNNPGFFTINFTEFGWLLLIVLFAPVITVFMLVLLAYRQLVRVLIKLKHGKDFGGLLNAADAVHVLETSRESKLGVLFVLKYKKSNPTSFYQTFENAVYSTSLIICPKTRAIFQKSMGYFYYLKNQVTLSECIHKITVTNDGKKVTDKSTFMQFLHEREDTPLPKDNAGLWDVFIGTNPIQWKSENTDEDADFYPILFRYHHSLFDGYHLLKTIFNNFSDERLPKQVTQQGGLPTVRCTMSAWIRSYIQHLGIIVITPWRLFMLTKTLAKDCNMLCGKKLRNEKLFGFNIEETPYYVDSIKTAKKKVPGTSFTDVVLTAISMALTKYFNASGDVPSHITVATPEVPHATNLLQIATTRNTKKQSVCENKVKFSLRKLPIGKQHMSADKKLELISQQGSYFKNPTAVEADYTVTHTLFALLPVPMLVRLFNTARYTAIVTNLPGPRATSFCNGHSLQDIVAWSISKETTRTGISFLISTYDNRLGVTMTADRAIISRYEDIDSIVKNIYIAIDDLTNSINHNDIAKAG
ncbi:hypothetical protein PPYR_04036 [Photinus pyralis]|uniref:O-acyltransferase WSD1 C-terminal domain-containing protein n=1 Tax=Photinus pyralis TaxID=7054 RepID=A0A1Y1M7K5_PHOPY|nr:uncharacterized protein LOC116164809 [Photinus pyralis]XP_031334891.1 uncharacterized protein LOC116164809 [Photinus pyralis]KAB0801850.1 hypothetical protein PPYR_04036 [Photinus pyralis]